MQFPVKPGASAAKNLVSLCLKIDRTGGMTRGRIAIQKLVWGQ